MRYILIAMALMLAGCATPANGTNTWTAAEIQTAKADIMNVLEVQSVAWNEGDIDAFMEGYWKSEDLRFGSSGNITHGWQATVDRYKRGYKDRAAMGTLAFDDLDIQVFSSDAAVVHGRWLLERASDKPSGLFTLVFRDFGQGWVIVSDTTTSASAG